MRLPALLTSLGDLKLTNALQLRIFRKEITPAEARRAYTAAREDVRAGVILVHPLADSICALSRRIALRWTPKLGNRSQDVIHVTAALELGVDSFETFDERQRRLAQAIGLNAP
jgi:predicted nucleic acid-binding protein